MHTTITIEQLFNTHKEHLKLTWASGTQLGSQTIRQKPDDYSSLVGYLNFVHPQQITILGLQEFNYLAKLEVKSYTDAIQQICTSKPLLIVIADEQIPTAEILAMAEENNIPLFTTIRSAEVILEHLSHYLMTHLAPALTVHGVFLEVFDLGVLLTGESGVGKSELALELITRGHRLIADDSPVFSQYNPSELIGSCPPLLQNLLEVRGLGIIDVHAMFGSTAIKHRKQLHLIVHVVDLSKKNLSEANRLQGIHRTCDLLNASIPEVTLPAAPGRSLSVLVEAAVRNQILKLNGYNAATIFEQRQQQAMENEILCN